jgi:SAM-dependent methyltransferase
VLALDVSPAMLERARAAVGEADNVELVLVSGERLDGVPGGVAQVTVCYLVLQHLPRRALVATYLREIARVLAPHGEAFVQLPVLDGRLRARAWRALRSVLVPLAWRVRRRAQDDPALRGVRLTREELDAALAHAGLRVLATDTGPDAPYRYSRDLFLRLTRA